MKEILLTGIKPTGKPHLGNYFGMLKQVVDYQDKYETYPYIVDLHSLTSVQNKEKLKQNIFETTVNCLSVGIDPKKVTYLKQSDVPQVAELTWIFNCLISMPYLMRAHAFKDAEAKNKEINVGVFDYPVLMAADILLAGAHVVPVGKDQEQHVEIARDIAQKFNNTFGETFVLPKAIIKEEVAVVPGLDGQKMSKSYGNVIPLIAETEELKELVAKIPTDNTPVEEPKDPDTNNVFLIHSLLLDDKEKSELRQKYLTPGLSYKEAKDNLFKDLENFISPIRERNKYWINNPKKVHTVLKKGGQKMHKKYENKMIDIRNKIGVKLY